MFPACALNVPWMHTTYSLAVGRATGALGLRSTLSLIPWIMCSDCSLILHWTFPSCALNVPFMCSERSLYVHWIFLKVHWTFPSNALNVQGMFPGSGLCAGCPGFEIHYRARDTSDAEVMFHCSLCGCAASSHPPTKQWEAEAKQVTFVYNHLFALSRLCYNQCLKRLTSAVSTEVASKRPNNEVKLLRPAWSGLLWSTLIGHYVHPTES
jgi:hypothetical protein